MGLLDKILGRGKKAAGDVTGDSSMRKRENFPDGFGTSISRLYTLDGTLNSSGACFSKSSSAGRFNCTVR